MSREDEFIRSNEAADIARVTTDTISRWCRDGKVKGNRDGSGRWLVEKNSLLSYLRSSGQNLDDNNQ